VLDYFGIDGHIMESTINLIIEKYCRDFQWDMLWFIFIGHGFGKGSGYLHGIDKKVNLT
jgi:hypothetical protein